MFKQNENSNETFLMILIHCVTLKTQILHRYAKIDFAYQRDNLSLSKLIKKEGRPAARNVSENGREKKPN